MGVIIIIFTHLIIIGLTNKWGPSNFQLLLWNVAFKLLTILEFNNCGLGTKTRDSM